MLKTGPLVIVEWEDAWFDTHHEQRFADEITPYRPAICSNTGFLVVRNAKELVLASSAMCSEHDRPGEVMYRDLMHIPSGMVRKVRRLK